MRKTAALLGAGALVAAGAAFATPAAAQDANATVYILHGVPGATVDVCVNGSVLLPNFAPGTLAPAQSLPAASYNVAVVAPGAGCEATGDQLLIGPADIPVEAGKNYTIVAHLAENGDLTATRFENDTAAAGAGQGKLTARHTAQAPTVNVLVDGGDQGSFSNGEQIGPATLPAGAYTVDIQAGGTSVKEVPGVPVNAGVNTIAYAWGTAEDLQVATQTIDLAHSAPGGVPGGESGAAAAGMTGWVLAAAGLGLAGAAYSGRRMASARR